MNVFEDEMVPGVMKQHVTDACGLCSDVAQIYVFFC